MYWCSKWRFPHVIWINIRTWVLKLITSPASSFSLCSRKAFLACAVIIHVYMYLYRDGKVIKSVGSDQ